MASLTVTGASDDLIEIGGDILEEFACYKDWDEDEEVYLAFSDGTLLAVVYDKDGLWRFRSLVKGSAGFSKVEGSIENDTSDIVTLEGEIKWVVLGSDKASK